MKRVLIVDDEEDLTWSIAQHLKKDAERYELFTVNSGQEALEVLTQVPIDLVVSDIRMPEISGLDLLMDIREKYPTTKVIIMTAYGSSDIQNEASERGCFKYIEKPFEIQELRNLILDGVEDKKGFEGRVSDFQLSDLIQMNCLGRLTNALYIEKGMQTGTIYIEDGNIIHCQVGDAEGEDAFYEIMSWESGAFKVEKGRKSTKETIVKGWQGLLMESLRILDENSNSHSERAEARYKREQDLADILQSYGKGKGIIWLEIIDSKGNSLAKLNPDGRDNFQVLPLVNAIKELETESVQNLKLNQMNNAIIEFDDALMAFSKIPKRNEILLVVAKEDMNLGMVRMENKKVTKKIARVLDEYSSISI